MKSWHATMLMPAPPLNYILSESLISFPLLLLNLGLLPLTMITQLEQPAAAAAACIALADSLLRAFEVLLMDEFVTTRTISKRWTQIHITTRAKRLSTINHIWNNIYCRL